MTPCIEWEGIVRPDGYGEMYLSHNKVRWFFRAHRYVYEMLVGPVPDGLVLDHLCRNRACVNPEHLEPVTPAENNRRSESPTARNARKTHCPYGHELTGDNVRIRNGVNRGYRECRACHRLSTREHMRKHRARKARERAASLRKGGAP